MQTTTTWTTRCDTDVCGIWNLSHDAGDGEVRLTRNSTPQGRFLNRWSVQWGVRLGSGGWRSWGATFRTFEAAQARATEKRAAIEAHLAAKVVAS